MASLPCASSTCPNRRSDDAVSSLTVFALAVSLGQQTAWPLMNISQYAAQYPGVYFFRTGTTMCAAAMLLIAYTFWRDSRGHPFPEVKGASLQAGGREQRVHLRSKGPGPWAAFWFLLSGIGLAGAGIVSCYENNSVHTSSRFSCS